MLKETASAESATTTTANESKSNIKTYTSQTDNTSISHQRQRLIFGLIVMGYDACAIAYFLISCCTAHQMPSHWDWQHWLILATFVLTNIIGILLLKTKIGTNLIKKYFTVIIITSLVMGIAEGAPAAYFGGEAISNSNLSSGNSWISYSCSALILLSAGILSFVLFKASMDDSKTKLKSIRLRIQFVFACVFYKIMGQNEKIEKLILEIRKSEIDNSKEKKKRKNKNIDEIEHGDIRKEYFKSLFTFAAIFLSFAAAVTCAALAANCLIGMSDKSSMIALASIAFVAELIATTAIYNIYFVETVTKAIYKSPPSAAQTSPENKGNCLCNWLLWYLREITGKAHPKTEDEKNENTVVINNNEIQDNDQTNLPNQSLTKIQKTYRLIFAFIIKGVLLLSLSIAVCVIATYIFYLQLAQLNLPGIPSLSHNVIIGILVPGMLVTGIFRIVSLKRAADWTYNCAIRAFDWLREVKVQGLFNKICLSFVTMFKKLTNQTIKAKDSQKNNKQPSNKTWWHPFGIPFAMINGASLGSGVTSPKKLFPKCLQSHNSLCLAFYIITGAALTIASITANLIAWNEVSVKTNSETILKNPDDKTSGYGNETDTINTTCILS